MIDGDELAKKLLQLHTKQERQDPHNRVGRLLGCRECRSMSWPCSTVALVNRARG